MKTKSKVTVKRIRKQNPPGQQRTWYRRGRVGNRHPDPWFVMPTFNEPHPLAVLQSRLRFWENADEVHGKLHRAERLLVEKSMHSLPEDLRWLATRLEAMLETGYSAKAG